ncbi:MAG: diaminopimelate epimerase [Methanosarcinales archaeon]|nr:diaminopimelate epimerase [Methanosarcinales archaeon]
MVYKLKLDETTDTEMLEDRFGPRSLRFSKLHGNGNDFILIDEMSCSLVPEEKKISLAMKLCNRNFGIGADGVLFLTSSSQAEVGMRLLQPDGSEAEMCGNGIRCLAKYAWDSGYVAESFQVETLAGVLPVQVRMEGGTFWAKVEMGVPRFDRRSIPAAGNGELLKVRLEGLEVSAVNTGVPHAVVFVDDPELPIMEVAPGIRHHQTFPQGTNVNFVCLGSDLRVRTFERGVEGETFSCGTGAVASAAVARRLGHVGNRVLVRTKGGPLMVYFEGDRAFLEGPASTVFNGELTEEYLLSEGL